MLTKLWLLAGASRVPVSVAVDGAIVMWLVEDDSVPGHGRSPFGSPGENKKE